MATNPIALKPSDQYLSHYDPLIKGAIERFHIPGVSIAVTDGKDTWSKGYGISKFPNEEVNTKTLFNVASMTKVFIASAISFLVDDDEGYPQVKWTAPVSSIIKDFVLSEERAIEMVSVEDILSHRSGLPDQDDAILGVGSKTPDTVKSVTQKLRYLALSRPLRTKYQYCNIMYAVATHLIEELTGSWIGDYLRQRLWEPLKMSNTFFGLDDVINHEAKDQLATGYHWRDESSIYIEIPWMVQPEGNGAGEVWSTCNNYILFILSILQKSGPLSKKSLKELTKSRKIIHHNPKPFHSQALYALGLQVETYHGELVVSHSGSTTGSEQWGFVLLGNTQDASDAAEQHSWTMIDDLLNVPMDQRFDWVGAAQQEQEEERKRLASKKPLYRDIPKPPLPKTLPLAQYVGSYKHNGYETLVVELKDEKLWVDANDRTWPLTMFLVHVSGDFFVAEQTETYTKELDRRKAQLLLQLVELHMTHREGRGGPDVVAC